MQQINTPYPDFVITTKVYPIFTTPPRNIGVTYYEIVIIGYFSKVIFFAPNDGYDDQN